MQLWWCCDRGSSRDRGGFGKGGASGNGMAVFLAVVVGLVVGVVLEGGNNK